MGFTGGAEAIYPSGAPKIIPRFFMGFVLLNDLVYV
jgi:hypothetical protein